MPLFNYEAIDSTGKNVSGTLQADTREAANDMVFDRGLIPSSIREQTEEKEQAGALLTLRARLATVKTEELILFTKQFSTMLRAAVPIIRIFQVLDAQTENPKLKALVKDMLQDLQRGNSLHQVFARHPDVFPPLYTNMLKAGEASGSLSDVLERLIYILEHEHKVKSDIKSACRYPIMVLGMLGLAFLILLTFVVPKFAVMFEEAGIDLPIPTRICMLMYAGLSNFWYLILAALVGVGAFLFISLRTPHGQYVRDQLLMRLPVIGPLFVKSAMSRFSSIFAILQASGVSVLNSIDILCETIGNAAISHEFTRVRSQLVEGKGIAAPLRAARYFTPLVVNMAAIGEESGSLDEMLREVASHYDMEVEYATRKLTDMITPALTLGLAGVVGFFALAIYLPMWDMAKMAQQ